MDVLSWRIAAKLLQGIYAPKTCQHVLRALSFPRHL